MPAGAAPAGSGNGEVPSSVRLPPLTANAATLPIALSSTYRKLPSGLSRASTAPTLVPLIGVLPAAGSARRWERSVAGDGARRGVHGEQELAVVGDLHPARGHLVIRERGACDRRQLAVAVVSERRDGAAVRGGVVGVGDEQLTGLAGRNSLPNGPRPWAGNGDPGAAVSRPPEPTVKLSIREGPTSVPTSLVPVPLNSTSPGAASEASVTVDPGMRNRRPPSRAGSRCSRCGQPRSWPRRPGHRGPRGCRAACRGRRRRRRARG